jgi:hypothetical protein
MLSDQAVDIYSDMPQKTGRHKEKRYRILESRERAAAAKMPVK